MKKEMIRIKGARENNLKNIDLEVPRNQFVVFTGLSGSGKSSLAINRFFVFNCSAFSIESTPSH